MRKALLDASNKLVNVIEWEADSEYTPPVGLNMVTYDPLVHVYSVVVKVITVTETNRATIETKAKAALTANATYLSTAAPTNAEIAAQVKLLTRENNALIKLMLGLLDDTNGT